MSPTREGAPHRTVQTANGNGAAWSPGAVRLEGDRLVWQSGREFLVVEAWGKDAVRLRASPFGMPADPLVGRGALRAPAPSDPGIALEGGGGRLRNGLIEVRVDAKGRVVWNRSAGTRLLAETDRDTSGRPARRFRPLDGGLFRAELTLESQAGERFYGLGQQQHGRLDHAGCVVDLLQRNTEVCIPLVLSNRGYAFLWHNPAVGRVEFARNHTRWTADASAVFDVWIACAESVPGLVKRYIEATGPPPLVPEWALGLWQSRLRYASQEEVLEVARQYLDRDLPLSALVIDGGHWTRMGEWQFDPQDWPAPEGMVKALRDQGVETVVSVWPTVNPSATTRPEMESRGLLVGSRRGPDLPSRMLDVDGPGWKSLHLYDATHPEARKFLWERIRQGYGRHGIRGFWLDADEPEVHPLDPDNLVYDAGPGSAWHNLYPLEHARAFHEGLSSGGERYPLTLSRSAWAGSQRYGAAVWSGDVECSFDALRRQVVAGLNMGLSGIPWWTTDVGGFLGGDPHDGMFRELVVRWFQFATFCPLLRMHGYREDAERDQPIESLRGAGLAASDTTLSFRTLNGGPNEPWSYGEKVYPILAKHIRIRALLKSYLYELGREAAATGAPVMRPLFWHFPEDPASWVVQDQFLLGPDLLVAPILEHGARRRTVHLPQDADWVCAFTGEIREGGALRAVPAPVDRIPVFIRAGSRLEDQRELIFLDS